MSRRSKNPNAHHGFSYVGLLILIAILGVTLAATGEMWQTTRKRDKEDELLYAGHQFRQAIQRFYQQSPVGKGYPQTLDDLLKDPRVPNLRRYLRRIYRDPITDTTDWGLVQGPKGEIYGVYSKSEAEPIKKTNFNFADSTFEGATKYSQWQFVYLPRAPAAVAPVVPKPVAPLVATPLANRPIATFGSNH